MHPDTGLLHHDDWYTASTPSPPGSGFVNDTFVFDFDAWKALAERDPGAFEVQRAAVIGAYIGQLPADRRRRLAGLQWRIDVQRRKYRHPMAACRWLYDLMWESCAGREGLRAVIDGVAVADVDAHRPPSAMVLPFGKAATRD